MKNIHKILNKYAESTTRGICDPSCQLHNCRPLPGIDPEYPPGFGIVDVDCNDRAATLMGICNLCINTTARTRCQALAEKFFKSCKQGVENCEIYERACRQGSTPPAKETACACFVESCHISGLQGIIEDAYGNCDYFLGERFQETMRELDRNRNWNLKSCKRTLDICTRTSTSPADETSPRGDDMDEPPIQSI